MEDSLVDFQNNMSVSVPKHDRLKKDSGTVYSSSEISNNFLSLVLILLHNFLYNFRSTLIQSFVLHESINYDSKNCS